MHMVAADITPPRLDEITRPSN